MPGSTEVLQEYMIKLGYVVDQVSFKKMFAGLDTTGAKILKVGSVAATAVVAVEAAVAEFAYSMRKMYFAAELSGTTVKNLTAMSYAGKQVGISGEAMGSAIHSMAQAIRLNPGLQGLLESMGVKVEGRHIDDVMLDLVQATKQMPEFVGQQYASMFGIDPDTYHQMRDHLDELTKRKKENLDMYAQYGIDIDQQKQTMMEYANGLDNLEQHAKALGTVLLINLAPAFKAFNNELIKDMDWWGHVKIRSLEEAVKKLRNIFNYELVKLQQDDRIGADGKLKPEYQKKLDDMGHKPVGSSGDWLPGEKEAYDKFQAKLHGRLNFGLLPGESEAKIAFDEKLKKRLSLGSSNGSLADSALGKLISRGEGNYDSVNLGKAGGYKSSTRDLNNMTVDQVLMAQQKGEFNAVGKYQIIKDTMISAVNALKLTGKEKFDKSTQDRIFEQYLIQNKRKDIGDYVNGKSNDINKAIKAASMEWASIEDPETKKSHYEGVGNNKATISSDEMKKALQDARESQMNTKLGSEKPSATKEVSFTNTNTFHITGNSSKEIADQVALSASRVYGNALRDLSGAEV